MPRLFVAIDLPDPLKDRIAALKTDIPTARWVKPQAMHLTLRFIGAEVPAEKVDPIREALAGIEAQAFDVTLGGVGRFPPSRKKAPRVLWVGIQAAPALLTLHDAVERALEPVGFKPEKRPFNPHITLARLKTHKPTPQADAFLAEQADFVAGTFHVDRFILYQSELTPQGAIYTHLGVYRLQDPAYG
jgi:2'-5' RNA ligase